MFQIPFYEEIKDSDNILLCGAGGGYDIFGGIPLYFSLKNMKKKIAFASYSFTNFAHIYAEILNENCVIINEKARSDRDYRYFPEKILFDWLSKREKMSAPIYAIKTIGPKLLRETYERIHEEFEYDCIVMIDGGTDSLLIGNEYKIGSFYEDITSLVSIDNLRIGTTYGSYLGIIGFGIDAHHGVSHHDVLSSIAQLVEGGGFLGSIGLTKEMEGVSEYMDLVEYANLKLPHHQSIVQNCIRDALLGKFGNYHSTDRTKGSQLFINSLMSQMWFFDIYDVVGRLPYARNLSNAQTLDEVERIISEFRKKGVKRHKSFLI